MKNIFFFTSKRSQFFKLIILLICFKNGECQSNLEVAFTKNKKLSVISVADPTKVIVVNQDSLEQKIWNGEKFVRFPDEVSKDLIILDKWVFALGIQSPHDNNLWICLERTIIGNDYNVFLFNNEKSTKALLFSDNTFKPDEFAFKPIGWSSNPDEIYFERLIFDSANRHEGIYVYNIKSNNLKTLNFSSNYLTTPILSVDRSYFLYGFTNKIIKDLVHGSIEGIAILDIQKEKTTILDSQSDSIYEIKGWVENKQTIKKSNISIKNPQIAGFKLPWEAGKTYCVTRDGTPAPTGIIGSTSSCFVNPPLRHDYVATDFDTPNNADDKVLAVASGVVTVANYSSNPGGFNPTGYGNWVIITHPNNYRTLYAHLKSVNVSVGDNVSQGCFIGIEGTTGTSTFDHLHFEYEYPGGISGNLYTTFDECNCFPHVEYNYTSSNTLVNCTIQCTSPTNDNCSSATAITSNGTSRSGTIACATGSYGANLCNGCSCTSTDDKDVYYSFSAQATSHTVTVSNYASNFDAVIELRTACGFGTAISCYDPVGSPTSVSNTWNSLTIGQTYYIRVFEFDNITSPPSSPTFDISVTHTSNSCIIPGIPVSVSGSATGQTTANLSWAAGSPVGSSTVTYYWVVGTSSSVTYGNGIAQGSTTGTSASATGLSAGSTYYLRVYANTSCNNTSSNYGTSSTFTTTTLCTTPGTPTSVSGSHTGPTTANLSWSAGSPSGSPTVTYFWVIGTSSLVTYGNGVAQGSTTGTSVSATGLSTGVTYYLRVYANTNCNNTSSNYGTSFAFATSSTCITPGTPINLSGSPTGQTTANLSWAAGNPVGSSPVTYYWVVGTSPSVTWANGVAQNSTSETFAFATGLTSGTTYYLRVYATTDCYNSSSNYGTSSAFTTTSGGGVPPNDNCSGATTLLVNSTCNYLTNQTTANATAEFPPSTCSGFSSTFGYDVWYKFVANSTNQTIKVLGGLVFDSVVGLYSSCSSNSLIDCIDATVIEEEETLNVSGLTVGTTYYVRVYNFGGQVGTFAICVVGTGQQNPPGNFNITLTPQCNGATSRVYVQWTQASNATNYDIYRNGTPYYSNTPYDQTGFYDNGVVSGVVYTYKVVAKNTGGNTDNSNGTLQATALNCSCIDNPTLPTYNNGAVVQIKAPNTINATNKINTGANILFQAGKTIYLNPGFIVEQGAIFIAQMGGCNN